MADDSLPPGDSSPVLVGGGFDARTALDVLAVVLLVAGVIGLLVVLFRVDDLLGWGALSVTAIAGGLALGYDRGR